MTFDMKILQKIDICFILSSFSFLSEYNVIWKYDERMNEEIKTVFMRKEWRKLFEKVTFKHCKRIVNETTR